MSRRTITDAQRFGVWKVGGGPLALVQNGDLIRLDLAGRRIDMLVNDTELTRRRAGWVPPTAPAGGDRGYLRLYRRSVLQADQGCDFDFLVPGAGA